MPRKGKPPRTNTMRLLESHKVEYEVFTFSPDIHSATEVAEVLGLPPQTVYKTLVVQRAAGVSVRQGRPLLVMTPGDEQMDLQTLAASLGEKKLQMASQRDAEALTGLQVGGISALALLNKGFEVCLDQSAKNLERIVISAGQRGINLRLPVADLVRITNVRWVDARGK